jgi:hypothetical protein
MGLDLWGGVVLLLFPPLLIVDAPTPGGSWLGRALDSLRCGPP